jgi:hypothetical protein
MNHKRGKPKSSRGGCLLCKPQKHQRVKGGDRARRELDARRHEERAAIQ